MKNYIIQALHLALNYRLKVLRFYFVVPPQYLLRYLSISAIGPDERSEEGLRGLNDVRTYFITSLWFRTVILKSRFEREC